VLRRLSEEVKETDIPEEGHIALVANVISEWDRVQHFAQGPPILGGPIPAHNTIVFADAGH
jgi:hypothetical protein